MTLSVTGPLLACIRQREEMKTAQIILENQMLKNGPKQPVLSLVLIMSRGEVFKFLDRLGRDSGFIQVVPVSRSP